MSKMKRKWLRVIEYEETGRPIDEVTRTSLLETHPDLPILLDEAAMGGGIDVEDEQQQMPGAAPAVAMMMQAGLSATGMGGMAGGVAMLPMESQIEPQLAQGFQQDITPDGLRHS